METQKTSNIPLEGTNTVERLLEIIRKKDEEIASLQAEIEKFKIQVAWFERQAFGSKAEHYIPHDDTPSLFPEEKASAPQQESEPVTVVAAHERKKRQPNALAEIPPDIPREERIIDVPEDQRQGMKLIGYVESERVAYKTGLYVIHYKRAKYADPEDATRGVITAPAPGDVLDSASGRSRYDVSFIAKVVSDKVENAIPLPLSFRSGRRLGALPLNWSMSSLHWPKRFSRRNGRLHRLRKRSHTH